MLKLYGITSFVDPATLEKLEAYSKDHPELFQTEIVRPKDHTGEVGKVMFLFTPSVEICVTPFNHFHYLNDFEIGLTIDRSFRIADLEERLTSNGFQFESGFFGGNEENSYFLIPRRNGLFTPFFVISEKDSSRNRYLSNIEEMSLQISEEKFDTTESFIELFDLRKVVRIETSKGKRNRVKQVVARIEAEISELADIRIDNVKMTFQKQTWKFQQEELRKPTS